MKNGGIKIGDCFQMPIGPVVVMDIGEFFIKVKWGKDQNTYYSTVTPRQLLRYPRVKIELKNETQTVSS